MYGLSNEEKLKLIKKFSKELDVTAYEFGNNTELSDIGAANILSGESKKPRTKTLNMMLQYLQSKKIGSHHKTEDAILHKVEEPEKNTSSNLEEIIYSKMYSRLQPELDALTKKIIDLRMDLKRLHENQVEIKKNIRKGQSTTSSKSS